MNLSNILNEVKYELKNLYGTNLQNIILYGSYARNEAHENSDIDILVVLSKLDSAGKEIDRMVDVTYDINLKYNVLVSLLPVSADEYKNINSPLMLNIRKEGIAA